MIEPVEAALSSKEWARCILDRPFDWITPAFSEFFDMTGMGFLTAFGDIGV
jgi:hypothetical protein